MAANRPKSEGTSPRTPVGQVNCWFGTYTVDETAKTASFNIGRCTFPQWDEIDGTDNIVMPTENELKYNYYAAYSGSDDGSLRSPSKS
jgi:hypothetical protein